MRELMSETGVSLETAGLEEALRRLTDDNEAAYQLVLFDWDIPESDGIKAVRKLREALPGSIPILLLAEYDADGMEEALATENTEVLTKPFFASALRMKIAEMQEDTDREKEKEPEKADSLEGLHFLAAEDNEINAEILTEVLKMEGASCEIVENGRLAVERFEQAAEGEFDAILMDVQMPVLNGYDAARAIRSLTREDAQRIPIIAMTANAFAEDEKAALDAGMNAHVAKPLDVELLKKVIREYVK